MSDFEDAENYALQYTTPPAEPLVRLGEETESTQETPQMSVGPLEGTFLRFLVWMKQPRRVLEIGVFTGWSGIEIARGLPEGGTLVALDVNPDTTAIAKRYAEEMGVADRIDYRVGDAKELVRELKGRFDLVFIDAWKPDYVEYYEAVLPLLADDGVILADNTLSDSVRPFNEHVLHDERVECVLVPIRDGVTLIRRRV